MFEVLKIPCSMKVGLGYVLVFCLRVYLQSIVNMSFPVVQTLANMNRGKIHP